MLKNKCYLKDIREYEDRTQINVVTFLETFSVDNIIQMLSIIYNNEDIEFICNLIDEYIDDDHDYYDLYNEVRNILLGYDMNEQGNNTSENNEEASTFEDISSYKFLSDFYMHLCMQLMSLGMSYSEFWSLTTKEMYQAYSAIKQKMVIDYNRDMQNYHTLSLMIGGAVWGKGLKEAPHVDLDSVAGDPNEYIDTEFGPMTREDYKLYKELG